MTSQWTRQADGLGYYFFMPLYGGLGDIVKVVRTDTWMVCTFGSPILTPLIAWNGWWYRIEYPDITMIPGDPLTLKKVWDKDRFPDT